MGVHKNREVGQGGSKQQGLQWGTGLRPPVESQPRALWVQAMVLVMAELHGQQFSAPETISLKA